MEIDWHQRLHRRPQWASQLHCWHLRWNAGHKTCTSTEYMRCVHQRQFWMGWDTVTSERGCETSIHLWYPISSYSKGIKHNFLWTRSCRRLFGLGLWGCVELGIHAIHAPSLTRGCWIRPEVLIDFQIHMRCPSSPFNIFKIFYKIIPWNCLFLNTFVLFLQPNAECF